MSGFAWRGASPTELIATLHAYGDKLDERTEEIMDDAVEEGGQRMQDTLETAETKTGRARVDSGSGAFPGRHVTGQMVDAVASSETKEGDTWIGRWGWANPEVYFLAQDSGTDTLPAAHSLLESFVAIREAFIGEVREATRRPNRLRVRDPKVSRVLVHLHNYQYMKCLLGEVAPQMHFKYVCS
jgi:hypothetical protein